MPQPLTQPPPDAKRVRVANCDRDLACLVCGHDQFTRTERLMNSMGATALGFDWVNRRVTCFVCVRCSYVHWFYGRE